jgi:CRP/FNR family cyclic AMP-dependent transcriptional regulator
VNRPHDGIVDPFMLERLLGLAGFCMRAGDLARAQRVLEVAERRGLDPLRVQLGRARLAILSGLPEEAEGCLRTARDLDPFDEDAADLLGQLLEASGETEEALDCLLDARVVSGSVDSERGAIYDEPIERLCARLGLGDEAKRDRLAGRAARLEEMALEAEELGEQPEIVEDEAAEDGAPHPPMREVLKDVAPFSRLEEAELRLLECAVDRVRVRASAPVFREGQPSEDLFVVEEGRVSIQRETPFGTQVLATVPADGLFGEMNFIDGLKRSADAVAAEDSTLLRISHQALREIFQVEPRLAVTFLEQFWRGLADKIREGNELMKTFFTEAEKAGAVDPTKKKAVAQGHSAHVETGAKDDVLQEKGLTTSELKRIAQIAEARRFATEEVIFREGDHGRSLYIIVDGRVRIEKHIPGIGQEALAILERGDFFGEMAIIDDAPRSASAIAHAPDTTVVVIEKGALDRLLEQKGDAAHELLQILCRLLSSRLREINDKIVQWRLMSGGGF